MKLVTYISNIKDIDEFNHLISDGIVATSEFSIRGTLSIENAINIINALKRSNIRPILELDTLVVEQDFDRYFFILNQLIKESEVELVRVKDIGVFNRIIREFKELKIQLILENSYHNLNGLLKLVSCFGMRIDRLIISSQLPRETISLFSSNLKVPIEVLMLGELGVFYSPRKLLRSIFNDDDKDELKAVISSREGNLVNLVTTTNRHGTSIVGRYMRSLLEHIDDLKNSGTDFVKIDVRGAKSEIYLIKEIGLFIRDGNENRLIDIHRSLNRKTVPGFFNANKTDLIFKKLKNDKISRDSETYIAEVLEVKKGEYIAVFLQNSRYSLSLGQEIKISTPEGKTKTFIITKLQTSGLTDIDRVSDGLAVINYCSGVSVRSIVEKIAVK